MFRIFHRQPESLVRRIKEEQLIVASMSMVKVISHTLTCYDYNDKQKLERIEKAIANYEKVRKRIGLY